MRSGGWGGGQKPRSLAVFPPSCCCISSTSSCFSSSGPLTRDPRSLDFITLAMCDRTGRRRPFFFFDPATASAFCVFFFSSSDKLVGGRKKKWPQSSFEARNQRGIWESREREREEFISAGGLRRCLHSGVIASFCIAFSLYLCVYLHPHAILYHEIINYNFL